MARYTGSVCRQCRREGVKLFLKGDRCFSEKCAINKRHTPPDAVRSSLLGRNGAIRPSCGPHNKNRPDSPDGYG